MPVLQTFVLAACGLAVSRKPPTIAIVGRPNVGKSTIANRMTQRFDSGAIVHDEAGVTRDRTYGYGWWAAHEFAVVDTRRIPCDSRLVDARGTDRRTGERVTVRIRVPLDARAEGARLSAACWHVCLEMSVVESASAHARAMARCWAETALLGEEEAHGDDSGSAPA